MNRIRIYIVMIGVVISTALVSCKKLLEAEPEGVLEEKQMYQDVYDADAAVVGIYGKFLGLAPQYIVLNELRGDLMDITTNSDKNLKQINNFSVEKGNLYADPRPFYEVIFYCNDALKNFKIMLEEGKLKQIDYDTRYSDIGALRSWLYLQLGIQFGSIPYVTEPIEVIDDLDNEDRYPKVNLDKLLDELIMFTESLPYKDNYPEGTTLLTTVDAYNTAKFFINKHMLLGDLYLWKGNYREAAAQYRDLLETAASNQKPGSSEFFEVYRMTGEFSNISGLDWINIFAQPYGERYSNYENLWLLPFDKSFSPANPFISMFANLGRGKYLLQPSALSIEKWDSQMRADDTPYDIRGRTFSWTLSGGQPIVNKQIAAYNPVLPFETNGKWILYRAATVHLRFAEAANRDNQHKLADAFLNNGIKRTFDPTPGISNRDVTNIMNTLNFPAPYNFDAREGQFPYFRGDWYRNIGVRSRVSAKLSVISHADSTRFFDMSNADPYQRAVTDHQGLALLMENKLVEESALELAFEGYRWSDLLRIALRREKEAPGTGVSFLQAHINAKFAATAVAAPDLSNKNNWFLPFEWD